VGGLEVRRAGGGVLGGGGRRPALHGGFRRGEGAVGAQVAWGALAGVGEGGGQLCGARNRPERGARRGCRPGRRRRLCAVCGGGSGGGRPCAGEEDGLIGVAWTGKRGAARADRPRRVRRRAAPVPRRAGRRTAAGLPRARAGGAPSVCAPPRDGAVHREGAGGAWTEARRRGSAGRRGGGVPARARRATSRTARRRPAGPRSAPVQNRFSPKK
jgi:hypothetical protein